MMPTTSSAPPLRHQPNGEGEAMSQDDVSADRLDRVVVFLDATRPHWACRGCIASTMALTVRDVKIALLRLAHLRGRGIFESACETCVGCGLQTAVVRLSQPRRLKRVA
jgi:hypothetical protein